MRRLVVVLVLVACGGEHATPSDAAIDAVPDAPLCAALSCDDGNPCTMDSCDPIHGCRNVSLDHCAQPLCELGTCAGPDTDGDGLSDAVESQGYVDLDCDGVFHDDADLVLPMASVTRPTIYLEYDYMEMPGAGNACSTDADCAVPGEQCLGTCSGGNDLDCAVASECPFHESCAAPVCTHSHRPKPAALQMVVAAFAAQGIDLVIEPYPTRLPETAVVTFDSTLPPACVGPSASDFYALKAANMTPQRAHIYHYAVFGHYATCPSGTACLACPDDVSTNAKPPFGASGTAELPGNDFIISLAHRYFDLALPHTLVSEAGTVMHELGHNLGLRHGGNESTPEGKPNYFSVMNRTHQFNGIVSATTGTRVDYSGAVLATLDENALVESLGVGEGAVDPLHSDDLVYFTDGLGVDRSVPGTGAIDWSGNGTIEAGALATGVDTNGDGSFTTMTGWNDWAHLALPFQCTMAGAANGYVPVAVPPER